MGKHNDNFERANEDMDKANDALDDGNIAGAVFYAGKGIVSPVAEVIKDPVGFLIEWLRD